MRCVRVSLAGIVIPLSQINRLCELMELDVDPSPTV